MDVGEEKLINRHDVLDPETRKLPIMFLYNLQKNFNRITCRGPVRYD